MAGASMKDIKLRIRSVENTRQITKAMQLVASSKLRGARSRMEDSRPYLVSSQRTIGEIAAHSAGVQSPWLSEREVRRRCVVVIAGDRGMAGSYNASVFKAVQPLLDGVQACVMPVGRKARERFAHETVEMLECGVDRVDGATPEAFEPAARELMRAFAAMECDEVLLAYTTFVSVLTQKPVVKRLLPIEAEPAQKTTRQMIFEPGVDVLLKQFLPQYLAGVLYAAACDSSVSEQAARRVAMDSATRNADEMLDSLNLRYNRARQTSITQEITEIVAGAEQ